MKKKGAGTKLIHLMLLLALTAGLAACGSNNESPLPSGSASGTESAATADTREPAAEPVEITVWDKPHADDPRKAFFDEKFAEFDAKFPNIKVTHVEQTSGGEREQFMTAVAGGEQPDAILTAFSSMELYIQQGIAADITEHWNNFKDKDKYLPGSLLPGSKDGKIYGIPNAMYTTGLYYNKKIFQDAGLDPNSPPKTWDEFIEVAKKTTDRAKGINGFDILGMDWADWHFEYYVWAAGGDLTEKNTDGSVKLTFTSEPAVKALQYYKDMKWTHDVTQKNVVQSLDDNLKDFYTGHAAMIVGASDNLGSFITKGMKIEDIGFAPFPAGPSGKAPAQVGGAYWIFNPKASNEQMEAAFTYVTFMDSKENMESSLQYQKDNGSIVNLLSVRSDVDVSKYIDNLPTDIVQNVTKASADPHLEYFLKDRLSPYVVKAIQQVLLKKDADPLTELRAAQDLAQKEVVDKYNAELTK